MCLCTQVQGPEEDKRWHWIPGARVPGSCGPPEGGAGNQSWSLWKSNMLS